MRWRVVGVLSVVLLSVLVVACVVLRERQERRLVVAAAAFSSEPLFIGVSPPPSLGRTAPGCAAVPAGLREIGPALSLAQFHGTPLAAEAAWQVLAQRAMPGDRVRLYRSGAAADAAGGYLLLRGRCLLGQVPSWTPHDVDPID